MYVDNRQERFYNNAMTNKEIRKNEILKNSIELIHLNGYNGTSVKDITDAASIPKGSFYNYFRDKEEYAVEALNYYFNETQGDQIALLEDPTMAPLARIEAFFTGGMKALEEKGYKYGCLAGNMSEEMADVNPVIGEAAADFHERIKAKIYQNLVEAKDVGALTWTMPLDTLASFILSSWQGAMLRMKTNNNRQVLDDFYSILVGVLLK